MATLNANVVRKHLQGKTSNIPARALPEDAKYTSNSPLKNFDELGKSYLQPHMRHFTSIMDSGADASAVFNILRASSAFSPKVKDASIQIINVIRNPWAHYDSVYWDEENFLQAFRLFEDLLDLMENDTYSVFQTAERNPPTR